MLTLVTEQLQQHDLLQQFCNMSSLVCLWGNLLSWLMFRNGQQHKTCGLGGWPNQLFGHFYFKRLPSHYGCSRLCNFILLEITYLLV